MSIGVQCPGCGKKLTAKDELAGKRVKCPACSLAVVVPTPPVPLGEKTGTGAASNSAADSRSRAKSEAGADDQGANSPHAGTPASPAMSFKQNLLLMAALFLIFGTGLMLAAVVFKGGLERILAGLIAIAALIGACFFGARIQKQVIQAYPVLAQMMLSGHLQSEDEELTWIYGMTAPNALLPLLFPLTSTLLTKSFLLGLTKRRILLVNTTDRLSQELAFRSIDFSEITNAWTEDCADPHRVGPFAAKKGKLLHFELQDGAKFEIGSSYEFAGFSAHRDNLERFVSFLAEPKFRGEQ